PLTPPTAATSSPSPTPDHSPTGNKTLRRCSPTHSPKPSNSNAPCRREPHDPNPSRRLRRKNEGRRTLRQLRMGHPQGLGSSPRRHRLGRGPRRAPQRHPQNPMDHPRRDPRRGPSHARRKTHALRRSPTPQPGRRRRLPARATRRTPRRATRRPPPPAAEPPRSPPPSATTRSEPCAPKNASTTPFPHPPTRTTPSATCTRYAPHPAPRYAPQPPARSPSNPVWTRSLKHAEN